MNSPRCPGCHTEMREGFLLDRYGEYHRENLFWVSGNFSSYMLGHETTLPVVSWRCPSCGLLASYAVEEEPQYTSNHPDQRSCVPANDAVTRQYTDECRENASLC
ncbi:PF20097 family protein [Aporhodopirellula aestuarii]|uniref:PF20097 family protein n=1 Tax=Aporhodopirellula aestuarii TaxID=2950107 RepID=A0ABT0UAF4_9BACT|nr:PF20097 family protein [Aporhodopirellula aestuarii]MCM2373674.1 PF20097 family protein [Aporhodopirellula aestuarii]